MITNKFDHEYIKLIYTQIELRNNIKACKISHEHCGKNVCFENCSIQNLRSIFLIFNCSSY